MSEQLWFIEASVSLLVLLPSLARAPTVTDREREKKHTHKSLMFAFIPPNP